ncbi:MAG: Nif3-like dinuclear metal center hexameric protein [Betaproteobacteria bacterium]|nr:Nif3-like dinuclear metal center hexameric protein [Betaproteobacteria bacterium]
MRRSELLEYLDRLLEPARLKDYCPNGLQVEGRGEVRRVVAGVTASLALLQAAVEERADAVLVHHGYFWRGEDQRVTGVRRARLATLLREDINLIAYHLPLDVHPELGNNACLGRLLGWQPDGRFADQDLGFLATLEGELAAGRVAAEVAVRLGREPLLLGDPDRPVRRVAWCTGGAQGLFEQAIGAGVDLYLSGEVSEPTAHLARESGVAYVSAGHHATERYGIEALGRHLAEHCGLECVFIDIDNPA